MMAVNELLNLSCPCLPYHRFRLFHQPLHVPPEACSNFESNVRQKSETLADCPKSCKVLPVCMQGLNVCRYRRLLRRRSTALQQLAMKLMPCKHSWLPSQRKQAAFVSSWGSCNHTGWNVSSSRSRSEACAACSTSKLQCLSQGILLMRLSTGALLNVVRNTNQADLCRERISFQYSDLRLTAYRCQLLSASWQLQYCSETAFSTAAWLSFCKRASCVKCLSCEPPQKV